MVVREQRREGRTGNKIEPSKSCSPETNFLQPDPSSSHSIPSMDHSNDKVRVLMI
jgi:hypothetical protein